MISVERARKRNWSKARLMGITFDRSVHTLSEIELIEDIMFNINILKETWDYQTEIFIGHPLKPFKCSCCSRRSTRQYLVETQNYCYKHWNEYATY